MEHNQVEEMNRAADRITEAVKELDATLNRFLLLQERLQRREQRFNEWRTDVDDYRRPGDLVLGLLGAGGLDDERATRLAVGLKRRGGNAGRVVTEAQDPGPEEVRNRREARQRAERGLSD